MKSLVSKRDGLMRQRREKGLTLIEASMVLALSAVVVAGVMLYYQSASDNNRLQGALGELGSIQTAVQTLYAGQSDYTGLATKGLIGNSSIPPSMQDVANNKLTNPWNAEVKVDVVAATPTQYTVEFDGVPAGGCVPFASQQLGSQMVSVKVNSTDAPTAGQPFTPDGAQTACDVTTSAGNKIIWTLK
ncbi:type 4 pilus major pilin [Trinickia fusca]|uniref:Pilus assembly protein n=1 Tax=Trinickia fusca TaxID=2419777 RepID=A0A494XMS2_9BURK|nr:type 4 pilus major pilin [Trinickia fusca]RKP51052.1 pilus assembly protein [Trinickia fusca]